MDSTQLENAQYRSESIVDLAKAMVAGISRCIPAELSGIDPRLTLGL